MSDEPVSAPAPPARPARVLIVDDLQDGRELLGDYLSLAGFEVLEAENGKLGVEKALAEQPSVILMDLTMPVMDGWEASRLLKDDPRTRAIPIIALSGHSLEGEVGVKKPACDSYLVRPCRPAAVVAEVKRILAAHVPVV